MHTVKRAIIMAAGIGKRMQPVTFKTPKPLIKVNGIRMIDTVIQALHKNHITEIYIVVGYLKVQFYPLEYQYPGVKIIENPYYDTCNNISSLYMARFFIKDCIILDGDQIIYNYDILHPNFECSGYNCIWTDSHTNEWLLTAKNKIIVSCSRTCGKNGWQLFSISRWTAEDGEKLRKHLELEFEKKQHTQIYWDDVALFCHPNEYTLQITPMKSGDIVEIDNFEELLLTDPSYQTYHL